MTRPPRMKKPIANPYRLCSPAVPVGYDVVCSTCPFTWTAVIVLFQIWITAGVPGLQATFPMNWRSIVVEAEICGGMANVALRYGVQVLVYGEGEVEEVHCWER